MILARPAREFYTPFYPRLSYPTLDRLRGAVEELGMLRRLPLERDAVLGLQASGVFELGAYSVRHRDLVQVPPFEAQRRVTESLRSVARLTGADARAAKPPGYAWQIGERVRIQLAPLCERARRLKSRLRRSRPRRLGAAR